MVVKPEDLAGRDSEWALLERGWESARPELLLVLGLRRVGKSYLLARFAGAVHGIYYQATRRGEAEQLRALTRLVGRRFDDPALQRGAPFEDWADLLRYVSDRAAGEPILLVLDEYTYLEEAAPGLASVLQAWVDHDLPGTRVKLVLSGSYVSAMKRLEAQDAPLYGRRTLRMTLKPFSAATAGRLYPAFSPRERLLTHGVFGGLPGNVSVIEPDRSFEHNVVRHVLDPSSRLFDEAQHLLDGFRAEQGIHHALLGAIAEGAHTWKAITSRTGKTSGSVSRPLQWLIDMDLVHRRVPVTENAPQRSRRAIYRLSDPYLRFWHRFLLPLIQVGLPATVAPEELWEQHVRDRLDDHMGSVFEDVARSAVEHATVPLPFRPIRVGAWWNSTSTEELDVVALSSDREVFAAECKWGTATAQDIARLQRRGALLMRGLESPRRLHLGLFTGRGLADDEARAAAESAGVTTFDLESVT